jgi:hypothetical protein
MRNELVELQEKLNGVYDFTDVVDCQSVIRMLLVDMKREKARTEAVWNKLQGVVQLVLDSRGCEPDIKNHVHGILNDKKNSTNHDVVGYLLKMSELAKQVSILNNNELVNDSIDVWSKISMDSKESAVIEELIERYRQAKGVGSNG